ncbi:FAD/NAD(P)-binding domain-containing protein [Morchella conica CCBAS932]|uniref:FAD/NAD(P)-binding domain-containing protein n=1 Tax=Morchella conica CCBAS932 TaxID=1392247 RepID=A0A3N4L269_9PEZI|nr:FAD/NAD(P)-binding domain-containing protein [Morchella conica CCBAS932]
MSSNSPTPTQKQTLLIVGAGIAGPTLSLTILTHPLLSTLYTPLLFDRLPSTPTATGAAVILSPNALHPLFQLGLQPSILTHSQEALSITMWRSKSPATAPGRRLNGITNPAFAPDLATGLRAIERSTLSRLLLEQVVAHGGEVIWDAKVTGYAQTPEGVEVLLEDGSRRSGHMLVGADGGWSCIRKQLMGGDGADWKPAFAGASAVYGIARQPKGADGEGEEDVAGRGHAVLLDVGGVATWALPGGRVFWSVSVAEAAPPEGKAVTEVEGEYGVVNTGGYSLESTEEILQRYEKLWFPTVGECGDLFKNSERIVRAPLWQRVYDEKDIANLSTAGNVVLIGDAARIMPTYSAALSEYVHERLPRSKAIARQAWWMGVAFMARNWWWRCVRDWVVRWVPMDREGGKGACAKRCVGVGAGAGGNGGEEVKEEKVAGPGAGGWLHGVRLGVEGCYDGGPTLRGVKRDDW